MSDVFYKKGLQFSCTGCSSCCRHDPGFVYLSSPDLEKLVAWSELSSDEFIETYCRWVSKSDGFEYLCLKEKKNYDCILWKDGCIAYAARPLQCSAYPFWSSLLIDEDWWNAAAETCPGMNTGRLFTFEEISAILEQRADQPYIRRKEKSESQEDA